VPELPGKEEGESHQKKKEDYKVLERSAILYGEAR
jgi:hypothetical protein